MKPSKLKPREGKVLRYLVAKTKQGESVLPAKTINQIEWSDLPHTILQAKAVFMKLARLGLAERQGDGYIATVAGIDLIRVADAEKLWNQ